jgi:hypothetical protein
MQPKAIARVLTSVILLYGPAAIGADGTEYSCDEDRFFVQHGDRDGKPSASWGHVIDSGGKKVRVSCGFVDGRTVRLGDMALFPDRSKAESFVWVYRGIGNSCSQVELLIFNEATRQLSILNVSTMQKSTYRCERKMQG